jgi:type II secretory pathway component PulF
LLLRRPPAHAPAMSLTVTPGQLTRRSEFYHQLAQLTAAGIGIPAALGQLARHPPSRSYRRPLQLAVAQLSEGATFTESLQQGDWLPEFDLALLHAGEQSGRLDACFRVLADHYADRARIGRQVIADLLYPLFLFHFAIFIFPFAQFFASGNWVRYLLQTFGVLIPIYLVVALVFYATQSRHGETWRSVIEFILRPVPILGSARKYLSLARLAGALEALLSAGVSIIQAWEMAARASGSPALSRAVLAWRPLVDAGQTPGETVNACREFPEMFSNQYLTGEISGKLDDTLIRLRNYYQEEGTRKLHTFAQWTPRMVYLLIVFMIATYVVRFWLGYFQNIQNIGF